MGPESFQTESCASWSLLIFQILKRKALKIFKKLPLLIWECTAITNLELNHKKKVIFRVLTKNTGGLWWNGSLSRGITPSAVLQQMSRWISFLVSRKREPINVKKLFLIMRHNHPRRITIFFFLVNTIIFVKRLMVLFLTMKSASEFKNNNNANGLFFLGFVSYGDRKV